MLLAGMVIDTDQAALENCEHAFDAVGCHAVANIFALTVIDGVVIEGQASDTNIGASFVRVNGRTDLDVLQDRVLDCLRVRAADRHGDGTTAALAHAENWRLAELYRAQP
jgi:hypothetical protein